MQKSITFKNAKISFSDVGKGTAVVLIHGFLENSTMWKNITPELSKRNRIITVDLLGHGKTDCLGYVHSMEIFAETIEAVLKHLRIRKSILIGHSLGGYVALAFAKLFTKNVKGLCLLNSTFEQDDKERKQLRKRANKMAQTNYQNLVRMSFINLFSKESSTFFKKEIELAIKEALQTSVQGYIAANEGMILRKNYKDFFTNATFKKAIILGEKDWIINAEEMISYAEKNGINYTLLSQGHMSHIENGEEIIYALKTFVKNC
ncbi:MAG: alpha/beta fold hydrolase [Polaribacter sp.]